MKLLISVMFIETGIDLIECCDRRTGVVHYKKPSAGVYICSSILYSIFTYFDIISE